LAEEKSERSREDLTEEASPYRIEEFRTKGIVAQSRELSGVVALLAAGITLYCYSTQIGKYISEYMRDVFRTDISSHIDLAGTHVLHSTLMQGLKVLVLAAFPVCFISFLLGILGSLMQIGSVFSWDPLKPDTEKISPFKGIQRILSIRQLLDGFRVVFKMLVISAVSYLLIKSEILKAPMLLLSEPGTLLSAYGQVGKGMFSVLLGILVFFSAIDFIMQRMEFSKNIRMTKQEAKQELKEREGDPQIKARVRSVQREIARRRMMQAVKKADVVITNPTHIAVAIVYDKEKMYAPTVVAKGADFLAQKIKQIATDASVPLVENIPLARSLYKSVKVGQGIPRALYQAVAEVLAYVYRLKSKRM
jgi:flagellar biosynthesis protein FlhB